jgi:hypothetical protein
VKKNKKSAFFCTFFIFYYGSFAAVMSHSEVVRLWQSGLLAIHLVCFFCFLAKELDQFFGFSNANVGAVRAQLLDKVKGGGYEILKEFISLELAHFFLGGVQR